METKETVYRKDYSEPDFLVTETVLYFDIRDEFVDVSSTLTLNYVGSGKVEEASLVLNAEDMEILSVEIDGVALAGGDYSYGESLLTFMGLSKKSKVSTKVRIDPYHNTQLMGFYKSGDILCSQCEAEGFRRITPFPDHPDILSRYTTVIEGTAPVLLSNGNLIDEKTLDNGRRVVTWQDPFPKPSYLFAIVAGDLGRIDDTFTTMTGRTIDLQIFTDRGNESRAYHAMDCLKMAMKWDEDTFGLEYDLDLFMVVAVDAFNFGAMENKGLNIFNSRAVLADKDITTDAGLDRISGIVAHEYFHNWTGNRVTCRDWFQLTLKEGLTVFRDRSFSSDTTSAGISRVEEAIELKAIQFPEDRGPNSHPIRPESYREIDNFYSSTVYRKGAEVIRMIKLFAGEKGFREGIDEYFRRHDGQAVTCEDFLCAMEKGGDLDLTQFRRWYTQAGTPQIEAQTTWDPQGNITLEVTQMTLPSADGSPKEPFYFPLNTALFNSDGSIHTQKLLIISKAKETFTFSGFTEKPVCSLLRDFSAPVILSYEQCDEDLFFLLTHESDSYSRYNAVKTLYSKILSMEIQKPGSALVKEKALYQALESILTEEDRDTHFASLLLTLPSLDEIGDLMTYPDYTLASKLKKALSERIGKALEQVMLSLYKSLGGTEYRYDREQVGNRALKGTLIGYLVRADQRYLKLAEEQYYRSDNMTDSSNALLTLCEYPSEEKKKALDHYLNRWKDQFLPLTNWFSYQSAADGDQAYDDVISLADHERFDKTNPNMIRSLYGGFIGNRAQFHHPSGRGYRLIAEKVIELDRVNRGVAASLAKTFVRYGQMGPESKSQMKKALESILASGSLSAGVLEVVENTLKSS